MSLSESMLDELRRHANQEAPWASRIGGPRGGWRRAENRVAASALVRRGLLESQQQSEHIRGERRIYWVEYHITDAGKREIASHDIT